MNENVNQNEPDPETAERIWRYAGVPSWIAGPAMAMEHVRELRGPNGERVIVSKLAAAPTIEELFVGLAEPSVSALDVLEALRVEKKPAGEKWTPLRSVKAMSKSILGGDPAAGSYNQARVLIPSEKPMPPRGSRR